MKNRNRLTMLLLQAAPYLLFLLILLLLFNFCLKIGQV